MQRDKQQMENIDFMCVYVYRRFFCSVCVEYEHLIMWFVLKPTQVIAHYTYDVRPCVHMLLNGMEM